MNRTLFICAAAPLLLAACEQTATQSEAACAPAAGDPVVVSDAWVRPAIGRNVTAAYFTICNAGETADALIGVDSDIAAALEIHESRTDDAGVASMAQLGALQLPAGVPVRLEPGGAHVMIIGLNRKIEEGVHVTLTLRFENADPITIEAESRS